MHRFMILIAVMSLIPLAGCGRKTQEQAAEKMIEAQMAKNGVKAKVDLSGDQVTVQTKEGTSTYSGGKGAKVPDTFPKDVCVYAGATVTAAVTVPEGFSLGLETADSTDKVLKAVKDKMTGEGWKEELNMSQGGATGPTMLAYKKAARTTTFVIASAGPKTSIQVTVAEGK